MVTSRLARNLLMVAPALCLFWLVPARAEEPCKAQKTDVAGCQPAAFDPPLAEMPTARIGASGAIDHKATEKQVRDGVKLLEKKLGLIRNFEEVHWVTLNPSVKDDKTGEYKDGDLDDRGDGRGLTIAGKCLIAGHGNFIKGNDSNKVQILRIADDPSKSPPVVVDTIDQPGPGFDDTTFNAALIKKADGKDTIILARDTEGPPSRVGRLYAYTLDPATCKVTSSSQPYMFGGDLHEISMWHDAANPKRILIITTAWNGALLPDPEKPGKLTPDIHVMAVNDETTGEMLPKPISLATFTLQTVGGPVKNERPDSTGLYSDGRFPDYSNLQYQNGKALTPMKQESNYTHQTRMSPDGERIYVAGANAGVYILNSEAVAHAKNADLLDGKAGCNQDSTNIFANDVMGGDIDKVKLAQVANDCIHMVVNDDPGVKELVKAGKIGAYLSLQDRSRWDPFPPRHTFTGIHSAIPVPDRPSLDKNNTKQRPQFLITTEETFECPEGGVSVIEIDSEITPMVIGTFGVPFETVEECIQMPVKEPNGEERKRVAWQAHDPTVFKNLVFVSWYGQGLRAIDISNPRNPREVGHANPLPNGDERSFPVYQDGLFYWMDTGNGLHIVRYTGPRADELPKPGDHMVYEGNALPHY